MSPGRNGRGTSATRPARQPRAAGDRRQAEAMSPAAQPRSRATQPRARVAEPRPAPRRTTAPHRGAPSTVARPDMPRQRTSAGRRPPAGPPRRPPKRRRPDPSRRLEVILILVLFVLTLVGGKLVQLQGLDRTAYAKMAAKQRLHTVTITAPRGTIVDRNGAPLAQTVDARDVYADPRHVRSEERRVGKEC